MSILAAPLDPAANILHPAEKHGDKFLNPVPTAMMRPGRAARMIRRLLLEKRLGEPKQPLGPFRTDSAVYSYPATHGLRVTWMGHSSLLIEIDGYRILTDPVWSERASFVSFAGPKRFYPPPLALKDLPPLDAVLISHDHYDHLDCATVQQLAASSALQQVPWICSLGVGRYLESWGIPRRLITELNWSNSASVRGGLQITATPARHFSGRSLWNRNETLWSSFVIRGNRHNLFFGGDSGFFAGFRQIGNAFGPFDLTMYGEDWPDIHMGPIKAAEAHIELQGRLLLPIHWGLFNLAFHPWREPVERLIDVADKRSLSLFLPRPGSPTDVTGASLHTFWWEMQGEATLRSLRVPSPA
jgi:L-ascorbate metabolism protein UlaG (beta-lactamase superfamily)